MCFMLVGIPNCLLWSIATLQNAGLMLTELCGSKLVPSLQNRHVKCVIIPHSSVLQIFFVRVRILEDERNSVRLVGAVIFAETVLPKSTESEE